MKRLIVLVSLMGAASCATQPYTAEDRAEDIRRLNESLPAMGRAANGMSNYFERTKPKTENCTIIDMGGGYYQERCTSN